MLHDHGIQVNGSFVLGFDHDRPDVFARTVEWIEAEPPGMRHVSHPHALSGHAAVRQMEADGRLLHKTVVEVRHGPRRLSSRHDDARATGRGYAWCYQRLFSHRSIWRRRPDDLRAVLPYLAMSYLYKRSNRFWHFLIRHDLVAAAWRPLVEWTRRRHLKFRRTWSGGRRPGRCAGTLISAGV